MKIINKTNSLFAIIVIICAVYNFMIKTFERYEIKHGNKNN
jgi:hypothetical protein